MSCFIQNIFTKILFRKVWNIMIKYWVSLQWCLQLTSVVHSSSDFKSIWANRILYFFYGIITITAKKQKISNIFYFFFNFGSEHWCELNMNKLNYSCRQTYTLINIGWVLAIKTKQTLISLLYLDTSKLFWLKKIQDLFSCLARNSLGKLTKLIQKIKRQKSVYEPLL